MFSLVLQLCLAALTLAAPIDSDPTFTVQADAWQYGTGGGILGFIVLVIDVLAWMEILKSNRPPLHKILWCVLIFILPVVGVIIYWLFADRAKHNSGAGYEPIA
ncbi:hypothetical protein M409DRAFT_20636 [Zasmidium cellare ATCC 36951]|uniref:Cardiolipin synthase N-terminal domain-containing protein n=1 Tax=Zasmidium cellare ATCC 36951 TaxID=1080233 RepID=A0A6A6CQ56_ZASCE|nr:uncharacterized protein M409DRAFT_20636 [Zasmidium cellare ATCC 36951]KAF2169417.1 hypothetical protein M409DRAFT_20636 [Zasmidium cellare ATCC 36951]